MYQGTFPPQSNRAGFSTAFQVLDDDTSDPVDIADCTIVFELVDPLDCTTALSATTDNAKVTISGLSTGVFQVDFTADDMRTLSARTYKVGCTISNDDTEPRQLIVATMPILFGVVT